MPEAKKPCGSAYVPGKVHAEHMRVRAEAKAMRDSDVPVSDPRWVRLAERLINADLKILDCAKDAHPGDRWHQAASGFKWSNSFSEPADAEV